MKKAVTTLDDFRRALARLEDEWHLAEHVRAIYGDDDEPLAWAHLQMSDPRPASRRGRGERVIVDVSTLWNQPPFGSDTAPLAALRRQITEWSGVEAVGEPTVDTMMHAIWGFAVTLRLSQ